MLYFTSFAVHMSINYVRYKKATQRRGALSRFCLKKETVPCCTAEYNKWLLDYIICFPPYNVADGEVLLGYLDAFKCCTCMPICPIPSTTTEIMSHTTFP